MDLDRAMQMLARLVPHGRPDLGAATRALMLDVLAGKTPIGLPAVEARELHGWLTAEFGAAADPAGALYQTMLDRVVEQDSNGSMSVRRARGAHRATGAYYTVTDVVRYMLRRARAYLPEARSVIDPACGSGALLAGALAEFTEGLERVCGLDSDPAAVAMCRSNLPQASVQEADALLEGVPCGFDLCIGNPPYISSGLRGASPQDSERQRLLKERYPRTAQYKINTYPLFIERGLALVRPGGVLGYIVPDSFLSGRYFEGLRRLLLEQTLLELTLVCEDFWEHGRVGQSVILFVRRGEAPAEHRVLVKACRRVADLAETEPVAIPLPDLAWGQFGRFPLIVDEQERQAARVMEKVAEGHTLGEHLRSYSGLIAKGGQQSLLRSANGTARGPWGRLLRSGREIDRYRLGWEGEEVSLDPTLIKSGGELTNYRRPKILLRQTSDSLRAVYDDQGFYCLNNIHLLVPRSPDTPLRGLLGLINSAPVDRFYRAMTMETGRLYPQVDLDILDAIPVPVLAQEMWRRLEHLVRERENAASPEEAAQCDLVIDELVRHFYGLS
jgi:SAM-dependent methyltransferase